jgi:hypothetical protein
MLLEIVSTGWTAWRSLMLRTLSCVKHGNYRLHDIASIVRSDREIYKSLFIVKRVECTLGMLLDPVVATFTLPEQFFRFFDCPVNLLGSNIDSTSC